MHKIVLVLVQVALVFDYLYCDATPTAKKSVKMPPELAAAILQAVQKCQPETGVGYDTLLLVYQGKYREDEQFKKFIYCSYKAAGFLQSDGHVDLEKSAAPFQKEPLVQEGVRRCGQQQDKNEKESVFKYFKCFLDTVPVRFTL